MRLCGTLWALLVVGVLSLGAPAPMWADIVDGGVSEDADSGVDTPVVDDEAVYSGWTSETSLPKTGTYKLMNSVVLSSQHTIGTWASSKPEEPSKVLTLDLNGHTITLEGNANLYIQVNGRLIIEDSAGGGMIVNTTGAGSSNEMIYSAGSFVLRGGTVKNLASGSHALFLNSSADGSILGGGIVDEAGSDSTVMVNSNASLVFSDGSIVNNSAHASAIYLNTNSKFTMTGGSIESAGVGGSKAAIYSNQRKQGDGFVAITGGTVASADTGIYSAFSPVDITGGSIEAGGPALQTRYAKVEAAEGSEVILKSDDCIVYSFSESSNSIKGATVEAPSLTSSYTKNETTLVVEDSTLAVDHIIKNDQSEATAGIDVTLNDGNKLEKVPSGLDESLPEGSKPVVGEDGSITVGGADSQAASIMVDGATVIYDKLSTAVEKVANGQTIKLLKANDEKVTVSKEISFTIDEEGITGSSYSIIAGSGYELDRSGNTYTFTKYAPPSPPIIIIPEYDVEVPAVEGGKITAKPSSAEKGDKVTLTVVPEAGQELRELKVTDGSGKAIELTENEDGTFTFTMPGGDVEISAVFGCDGGDLCISHKFPDFDADEWYHDPMDWAIENGYLMGFDDDGAIRPYGGATRAQVVVVLARIAGVDADSYSGSGFADVSDSAWYGRAVAWAVENGIVEGYGDGTFFGPDDPVTREQLAVILMRFAKFQGKDVAGRGDLEFPDTGSASDWAVDALSWAVSEGLLLGDDTTGELNPVDGSVRAELVTVLMRYMS